MLGGRLKAQCTGNYLQHLIVKLIVLCLIGLAYDKIMSIMHKKEDGDLRTSNLSSSRPPLSDDERKKVREVLDEACRAMLSRQNGSPPPDPTAANENSESIP